MFARWPFSVTMCDNKFPRTHVHYFFWCLQALQEVKWAGEASFEVVHEKPQASTDLWWQTPPSQTPEISWQLHHQSPPQSEKEIVFLSLLCLITRHQIKPCDSLPSPRIWHIWPLCRISRTLLSSLPPGLHPLLLGPPCSVRHATRLIDMGHRKMMWTSGSFFRKFSTVSFWRSSE